MDNLFPFHAAYDPYSAFRNLLALLTAAVFNALFLAFYVAVVLLVYQAMMP